MRTHELKAILLLGYERKFPNIYWFLSLCWSGKGDFVFYLQFLLYFRVNVLNGKNESVIFPRMQFIFAIWWRNHGTPHERLLSSQ
jgi:hypothetical protein